MQPYDMISSVRIYKGVFSSNIIFKAPGLINSGRRGKLHKMMGGYGDNSGLADQEGIITAIPKNKLTFLDYYYSIPIIENPGAKRY